MNLQTIDITGLWVNQFNRGWLDCVMIIKLDDLKKTYHSEDQMKQILAHYDRKAREYLKNQ